MPATLVTASTPARLDRSLGCPTDGMTAHDCYGLQPDLDLRIAVDDVDGTGPRRPSSATVRDDISDDDIVRLYVEGGCCAAEIAGQLGCSTSLVYARLGRGGVPRRDRAAGRRLRPADSELVHLYRGCRLSLRDLAGRHGVSAQTVYRWLVAGGSIGAHPVPGRPPAATIPSTCTWRAGLRR